MTVIHFVRHGQVYNPQQILYGHRPRFRLSSIGQIQAEKASSYLTAYPIAVVYSGPLLRARQTALPIATATGVRLRISALLNEVRTPYEGWPLDEFLKIPDIYSGISDEYEQPQDLVKRAQRFIRQVCCQYSNDHVVAVTHGDIILTIRMWVEQKPLRSQQGMRLKTYPAPGSITALQVDLNGKPLGLTYWEPDQDAT
jgi:broad specificity phosphatase PhoE